jgi:hypothetical protein
MPAGDTQRVWFPEMIEELRTSWSMTMPWEDLADFCARMTKKPTTHGNADGLHGDRQGSGRFS